MAPDDDKAGLLTKGGPSDGPPGDGNQLISGFEPVGVDAGAPVPAAKSTIRCRVAWPTDWPS